MSGGSCTVSEANDEQLKAAVEETLAAHPVAVDRWLANESGAWGFLAGQGILALRRRLERKLTDAERRRLWTALWNALEARRQRDC